jgi:hypothetical protein
LDQFSPRQSRPHFKIASIVAAGASQSKDRNDKQKTGFFDSINQKEIAAIKQTALKEAVGAFVVIALVDLQ